MKTRKPFLICFLAAMLLNLPLYAQSSYCSNLGFELGNFGGWVGHTWQYSTKYSINSPKVEGFSFRRHAIMTNLNNYDANTGYALKVIPNGYKYSARLGDVIISGDPSPRCWQQSLRYTFTVDSSNALLIMKFALVLQYAADHFAENEPRFKLTIYDQDGNIIPDCSNYDVYASNSSVNGFKLYQLSNTKVVQWRDWTTVGANLMNYYGQTITVEFMTADCTKTYHFGYAYFIAACHPLSITEKYCENDSVISLEAPEGFDTYTWTNRGGDVVGNRQHMEAIRPAEGEVYSCTMKSATGCTVTLKSNVAKYVPKAKFESYMVNCSNTVGFRNLSTSTRGSLQYKWDFGDGETSVQKHPPLHTFKTSGLHPVQLIVLNPPSVCSDTFLDKKVESFSGPLVGIIGDSTYCPGGRTVLKAYGAYNYTWSNGAKSDSLEVTSPGGTVWVIGKNSTGECISDTIRKEISEDPDWRFYSSGDTVFCEGGNTVLKALGAVSYRWDNGRTDDSLIVNVPGKYTVTGVNTRGCEKFHTFNVIESLLPDVGYTFTPSSLSSRQNHITCNIPARPDVQYDWDMGDGSTGLGPVIQHSYSINPETKQFVITLKATNKYGCTNNTRQIVDVFPFIPNVFSPNGDGVNDVFMGGTEAQVFDRNGLLLYHGNTGWDGRYNGKLLDPDTYFYMIRYSDRNNEVHIKKGYVTLVR